jgi:hypothetical protein
VHLTISTYQRQTLFDLTSKVFEEGMSVVWEEDRGCVGQSQPCRRGACAVASQEALPC